jgi:hypothetical protein
LADGKSSFVLYTEYLRHIQKMSMEQRGELFTAILCYAAGEPVLDLDAAADMAFSFIRERMDRDSAAYMEKVEKRREAGKLGGRPKANGFSEKQNKAKKANGFSEKQNNPDTVPVTDTVSVFEKESKEKSLRFSPPARQDVADYCKEKGFSDFDVERFVDYYTSNGWMVGKSKMKDWKAAVRNWARAGTAPRPNNTRGNKFSNFEQRQYDYDALETALLNSKPQGG